MLVCFKETECPNLTAEAVFDLSTEGTLGLPQPCLVRLSLEEPQSSLPLRTALHLRGTPAPLQAELLLSTYAKRGFSTKIPAREFRDDSDHCCV